MDYKELDIVCKFDEARTFDGMKDIKSKMIIGDLTILQTKKFNWLHKVMFKAFFGIEIVDIKK